MSDQTLLADWLIAECERQNLSWAEASRRAGISPNTISQIVSGVPPGIRRLTALAEFFGVSPEHLMHLAGLLPERPDHDDIDAEMRYIIDQLVEIWLRLKKTDPLALKRLTNIAVMQAEAFEAAVNAAHRAAEEEEGDPLPERTDKV